MQTSCYLIVAGNKRRFNDDVDPAGIRLTKNKPGTVKTNEIAVQIHLDIPDGLFVKPTLEAHVSIPEGATLGFTVTAEVQDNLAQIIREHSGLTVRVTGDEIGEDDE